MSRTFVSALGAIVAILAVGGAAGFWIFRMDRDPPHGKQSAGAATAKIKLPVGDTIYLTVNETETAPTLALPLTLRELGRQAFLIAARDELGLSTRDVMLREDFPKHPDDGLIPFELSARLAGGPADKLIQYRLVRQSPDEEELWRFTVQADIDDPKSIATVAEKAEAMSRGELKEKLTRAGGKGSVPAARASSEVPSATSDLLWAWNEISVMAGLRKVHAEIREKGESPQLIAALAVGYANLGSLTEYYYGAQCKVYSARALLYAERLLRKTDQSPWALWHRAYVRLQFGMHGAGGDDIAVAKKKQGNAAPAQPLPFWTEVVDVYAQGRLPQVLKVAKTPAQRRLARYLTLQAVILGDLQDLQIKAMKDFLADVPDCPRGFDMLAASGQIGTEQEGSNLGLVLTGILMRKRLPEVPGLTAQITERIRDKDATIGSAEIEFRRALIGALAQTGKPELDRGEPSLSAVGHSLDEMNFAQVVRKLEVDRNALGVPVDDAIAGLRPLIADHPYAAYIGAFAQHKEVVDAAAAELAQKLPLHELRLKNLVLLQWLASMTQKPEHAELWRIAGGHADMVVNDQLRMIEAGLYGDADSSAAASVNSMKHFGKTSSKLPVVIATLIARDWPRSSPQAGQYERDYVDDPLVMHALSNRYFKLKRYDDAERCAKQVVKLAPGYSSYRALAAIYKAKKDPTRWRETLDRAIKLPSNGLEQAQVQDEIAHALLEQKKWKEAVVYGDAAAESFSSWSLMTAARCHEMLGEWEKSEQLVKAVSGRYDDHILNWMCWCHRTGHGDVRGADEFAHGRIQAWGARLFGQQLRQIGIYFLIAGQPKKALTFFERVRETYSMMHAFLLADALNKMVLRGNFLKWILDAPPDKSDHDTGIEYYKQLAVQFERALKPENNQKLDLPAVDKILAASTDVLQPSALTYCVGVFLKNRGDVETAKKYLIRCAQSNDWDGFEHTLACQTLREMKVPLPPEDNGPKKDAPKALPKDSNNLDVKLQRPRHQLELTAS